MLVALRCDDGYCSCTLLLHPVLTIADAGPDLCNLCPGICTLRSDLCTLHHDLCTFCLWFFNWCKHSTCTPVVVVTSCNLCWWCFFVLPIAQMLHLHMWWYISPSVTCAGGAFSSSHNSCTCAQATCTVWCWSAVVVVV